MVKVNEINLRCKYYPGPFQQIWRVGPGQKYFLCLFFLPINFCLQITCGNRSRWPFFSTHQICSTGSLQANTDLWKGKSIPLPFRDRPCTLPLGRNFINLFWNMTCSYKNSTWFRTINRKINVLISSRSIRK